RHLVRRERRVQKLRDPPLTPFCSLPVRPSHLVDGPAASAGAIGIRYPRQSLLRIRELLEQPEPLLRLRSPSPATRIELLPFSPALRHRKSKHRFCKSTSLLG